MAREVDVSKSHVSWRDGFRRASQNIPWNLITDIRTPDIDGCTRIILDLGECGEALVPDFATRKRRRMAKLFPEMLDAWNAARQMSNEEILALRKQESSLPGDEDLVQTSRKKDDDASVGSAKSVTADVVDCPRCRYVRCGLSGIQKCSGCGFEYDASDRIMRLPSRRFATGALVLLTTVAIADLVYLSGWTTLFSQSLKKSIGELDFMVVSGLFALGAISYWSVFLARFVGCEDFILISDHGVRWTRGFGWEHNIPWEKVKSIRFSTEDPSTDRWGGKPVDPGAASHIVFRVAGEGYLKLPWRFTVIKRRRVALLEELRARWKATGELTDASHDC
jgi:hypothetical protein